MTGPGPDWVGRGGIDRATIEFRVRVTASNNGPGGPSLATEPNGHAARHLLAGAFVLVLAAAYVTTQVAGLPQAMVVIVAGVIGVYMALNIGANDVANNVGPAVGSGALTMAGALAIAAVFETMGALIAGGDVIGTISKEIIDPAAIPDVGSFVRLMLSALLAAAIWINVATYIGAPVSTTHSIVGGVLGAGLAAAGMNSVDWGVMGKIAASWVISPILGAAIAAAFLAAIKAGIVFREDKVAAAKRWLPVLVGIMGAAFTAYLLMKGLKRVWRPDGATILASSVAAFGLIYVMVRPLVSAAAKGMKNTREDISRLFTAPLIGAAALLSFAHGSNDVANAIGPLAAIVHTVGEGAITAKVTIPPWVMLIGAVGLAAGLILFGAKMVRRVGTEITEMDRLRAFTVALSSSITVIMASAMALPVSSTHIAIGAIFGVGFLREYLENEAGKVRAIRALFSDHREPQLFDTGRSEMAWRRAVVAELLKDESVELEAEHYAHLTERAETALKTWQRRKLVRRSLLRTIVMAWLVTVPTTALIAGLVYVAVSAVAFPGLADL